MNAYDTPTVAAVVGLINDNETLTKGVAFQAQLLRELRAEMDAMKANLDTSQYNEEFLKRQGRITRLKLRAAKRGRKEADRISRLVHERHEEDQQTIEKLSAVCQAPDIQLMEARTALRNRALEISHLRQFNDNLQAQLNRLQLAIVDRAAVEAPLPFVVMADKITGSRADFIVHDDVQMRMAQQRQTYPVRGPDKGYWPF